jgi:hypothetical protein
MATVKDWFNARVWVVKFDGSWGYITYRKVSSHAKFREFIERKYRWTVYHYYNWQTKEFIGTVKRSDYYSDMRCRSCGVGAKMYWTDRDKRNGRSETFYRDMCYTCFVKATGREPKSLRQLNEERKHMFNKNKKR